MRKASYTHETRSQRRALLVERYGSCLVENVVGTVRCVNLKTRTRYYGFFAASDGSHGVGREEGGGGEDVSLHESQEYY